MAKTIWRSYNKVADDLVKTKRRVTNLTSQSYSTEKVAT